MLWTLFVVLMALWLLGFVTGTTMGGFIHLLLIVAVVVPSYTLLLAVIPEVIVTV